MSVLLEVFCCYAREDAALLASLKKHLMPLQRAGQIKIWSDTDLNAGVDWERELHQHLESADIILLLISADFMNSDYCYSTEMQRAIARHDEGSARVVPVLLRPTFWRNAPFASLQVVPTNAEAVTRWSNSDDAFNDITEHLNRLLPEIQIPRLFSEVSSHRIAKRYREALACYEQVLALDAQNGPALVGRAEMLYQLGQVDASLKAFALAEQNAPAYHTSFFFLEYARALAQRERAQESLAAYDRALSLGILLPPFVAMIYAEKATLLIKQKAYYKALLALEQARQASPNDVGYLAQTGDLLFRLRRFEQALTMYEQASTLQTDESIYYECQGRILVYLERYEDALAAYKQALRVSPRIRYYEQAGKLLLQLGDYQGMLTLYDEMELISIGDPHQFRQSTPALLASKGQALFQLERYDEALTCYQDAIKQSAPDSDPQLYLDLATLHERLARNASLLAESQRAVWQEKAEPDVFFIPPTRYF